ncbi:plasmid pRiA4b ORF-3 family protein [Siminovitchia fortis]|uniref:Plasmid pRiA4b ORF-3 family protein n=1 Tax=Siminovitchia fortis TaxID=254758 RepID=A0A443IPL1_9BACI|nr:plasmid pRiA4b ORF-3 family protein [Siminovitchia fortis]RWR07763.1 plasmid pRiA4b ORF-3 family protein [Siminovitchia fortis]WHY82303.1 plasmid pRiA4b ORF-3 family protein [Siminovitchia fortis]
MIFQFKVTLMHMSPPVWRRLQVDSSMTFYQMHEIIQAAFDWDDYHLHAFMMKKSSGRNIHQIEIGSDDNDPWGFNMHDIYDEKEEKLSDWFLVEKDKAVYTYDFGDDWKHEILLEKIISPKEGVLYPHCVKAVQYAPEEDSRGELLEELYEVEEVDSKKLTAAVNKALSPFAKPVETNSDQMDINMKELFIKAKEFNALKPWDLFDNDEIFVVKDPLTSEYLFCSILGAMGEEFGMAVYIGPDGYQNLLKTMKEDIDTFELITEQRSILLSFVNRDELENEDYQLIKDNGMAFRGKKQWQQFRSFKPGFVPWVIEADEARLLTIAVEQAIEVIKEVENGLEIPYFTGDNPVIGRVPKTQGDKTQWNTTLLSPDRWKSQQPSPEEQQLLVPEMDIRRSLKYKKYDTPIEIDFFRVDTPVQEKPGERPYFPLMAVAIDQRSGQVIFQDLAEGQPEVGYYQNSFLMMMNQLERNPREVWLKSQTFHMLEPLLYELGTTVIEAERLPLTDELKQYLAQMM